MSAKLASLSPLDRVKFNHKQIEFHSSNISIKKEGMMKTIKSNVIIIGSGLTGLSLAYFLRNTNISITLLEANKTLGGRIITDKENATSPIELGATWVHGVNTHLLELLKDLNIEVFSQHIGSFAIVDNSPSAAFQKFELSPDNQDSFRVASGTSTIIEKLKSSIDQSQIYKNQKVESIEYQKETGFLVKSTNGIFESEIVISTLPPKTLVSTINISPKLPQSLINCAQNTHTWMSDSTRFGIRYETNFWKKSGNSGTVFSEKGPIVESYDHSNYDDRYFAIGGFLKSNLYALSKTERQELVINQLVNYYGEVARKFISYSEYVWKTDPLISPEGQNPTFPRQNNGDPKYQESYFENSFFIAGTETSAQFSGYMEGSIRSAKLVAQKLIEHYKSFD